MKKLIYFILLSMITAVKVANAQQTDSLPTASADQPTEAAQPVVTDSAAAMMNDLPEGAEAVELPEQIVMLADSAYSKDNFAEAEQLYLKVLESGVSSSALYYNLGNTYYRLGNYGKAIVSYERALKLDPTNKDARINLEFVNGRITDKQIDSSSYLDSVWEGTVGMFRADTWAVITLILFAVFLGAVATYLFSVSVTLKKGSFFGGLIVFILTVAATILSFAAANRINDNSYAIILPPAVQLSTSPREARSQAEQAFLLHEGTKVEIIDSIANPGEGMWYEVMVGHGERAWVKSTEVERI